LGQRLGVAPRELPALSDKTQSGLHLLLPVFNCRKKATLCLFIDRRTIRVKFLYAVSLLDI